MTLCLAWFHQNSIHFASDSRASHGDDHIDFLIKVMDVRVTIETPVENGATDIVYDHSLGLCFSGSILTSVIVKEHISEALRHLQFLPGHTEVSLRNICNTIGKFFKMVAKDFKQGYDLEPDSVFLITGYCPLLNSIAVYRLELFPGDVDGDYDLSVERMMEDPEEICYLGSGEDRARELIEDGGLSSTNELLGVMRQICHDEGDDVGGYIQYGKSEEKNFVVRGIQDYEIDEEGNLKILYTYRGVLMHDGDFVIDESELQIRMRYLCPFQKIINDHLTL